ncbi:hypothetical protein CEXT_542501 [Caerostris extrusa]|uniref:Uncharacterized protein n=1 Tax=Caerostris extrusa TaxID=172846 RepID=A0AAV4NW92_CAEEX|nr:hypothetical protein CEXT_542501 [Caerostris extrusa]
MDNLKWSECDIKPHIIRGIYFYIFQLYRHLDHLGKTAETRSKLFSCTAARKGSENRERKRRPSCYSQRRSGLQITKEKVALEITFPYWHKTNVDGYRLYKPIVRTGFN